VGYSIQLSSKTISIAPDLLNSFPTK
jgi:hypothetical protein